MMIGRDPDPRESIHLRCIEIATVMIGTEIEIDRDPVRLLEADRLVNLMNVQDHVREKED